VNRLQRENKKLLKMAEFLQGAIATEKDPKLVRALKRDLHQLADQLKERGIAIPGLELAGDAGEEHARRGKKAARLGFGVPRGVIKK
jgi:hypothetical protein